MKRLLEQREEEESHMPRAQQEEEAQSLNEESPTHKGQQEEQEKDDDEKKLVCNHEAVLWLENDDKDGILVLSHLINDASVFVNTKIYKDSDVSEESKQACEDWASSAAREKIDPELNHSPSGRLAGPLLVGFGFCLILATCIWFGYQPEIDKEVKHLQDGNENSALLLDTEEDASFDRLHPQDEAEQNQVLLHETDDETLVTTVQTPFDLASPAMIYDLFHRNAIFARPNRMPVFVLVSQLMPEVAGQRTGSDLIATAMKLEVIVPLLLLIALFLATVYFSWSHFRRGIAIRSTTEDIGLQARRNKLANLKAATERNPFGIAVHPESSTCLCDESFNKWVFRDTEESKEAFKELAEKLWMPLHVACRFNESVELLPLVEKYKADVHQKDMRGQSFLHYAFRYSPSLQVIRYFVEKYPEAVVQEKDKNGWTPLRHAFAYNRSEQVVGYLIDKYPEAVEREQG